MYKFFGLVLLSALVSVGAQRTVVNDALDAIIKYLNDQQRQNGASSTVLPEIQFDPEVKYSHAVFLGVDSFKRTADAWKEVKGNEVTIDISYGFGLLTIALPHLEMIGKNMSAYARVRDNSVHFSFTLQHDGEQCKAKVNEFRVERMQNVEFGTSDPELNGSNVDGFFKLAVVPKLNSIAKSSIAELEVPLQQLCNVKDIQNSTHVQDLLKPLL